jgi:hypothetical protein
MPIVSPANLNKSIIVSIYYRSFFNYFPTECTIKISLNVVGYLIGYLILKDPPKVLIELFFNLIMTFSAWYPIALLMSLIFISLLFEFTGQIKSYYISVNLVIGSGLIYLVKFVSYF